MSRYRTEKRFAAAVVIPGEFERVVIGIRAPDKKPYPNTPSLPSTYVKRKGVLVRKKISDDEIRKQVMEAVMKKLGLDIEVEKIISRKEGKQYEKKGTKKIPYDLTMTEFWAWPIGGKLKANGKDFSDAFYKDPSTVFEGERTKMGLCTQILMEQIKRDARFVSDRYFLKTGEKPLQPC